MPLYAPKNVPLNWLQYSFSGSLELLVSYVEGVEKQVENGMVRFRDNAETYVQVSEHPDDLGEFITHHLGLDDKTWDLDSVFNDYFPNLQRQSAIICLFSAFEHELNKLCELMQKHENCKVSFKDLNGNGIVRAKDYLVKVVELNIDTSTQNWMEIKNIQKIRNKIVHSNGTFRETDQEIHYIENCDYLEMNNETELVILEGFLNHFLNTTHEFCQQIQDEIDKKYK